MSIKNLKIAAISAIGVAGVVAEANAESLDISAEVFTVCEISAAAMDFGTVEAGQTPSTTTSVTFSACDDSGSFKVKIDGGTFGDGTTRRIAKGVDDDKIAYTLTDDAGLFIGEISPDEESGAVTQTDFSFNLTGTLNAADLNIASRGTYTDQIQITVDFTS